MSEEDVKGCYHVTDTRIDGFFKEHRFLSNFHICEIPYEGLIYTSTEAAFQAAKVNFVGNPELTKEQREPFTKMNPSEAKKYGRRITLREDWETVKRQIMFDICLIKFTEHQELRNKLLATKEKNLEETNYWGDKYWGVCNGEGENLLGEILMQIRKLINSKR